MKVRPGIVVFVLAAWSAGGTVADASAGMGAVWLDDFLETLERSAQSGQTSVEVPVVRASEVAVDSRTAGGEREQIGGKSETQEMITSAKTIEAGKSETAAAEKATSVAQAQDSGSSASGSAAVRREIVSEYYESVGSEDEAGDGRLEEMIKFVRSLRPVKKAGGGEPGLIEINSTADAGGEKDKGDAEDADRQKGGRSSEKEAVAKAAAGAEKAGESEGPDEQIVRREVVERLVRWCSEGGEVLEPAEVGRVLFVAGYYKEAAGFYERVLAAAAGADVQERAWALFQIGNCHYERQGGRAEAKKYYERLIAEHPSCEWADVAKSRIEIIDWYEQARPESLLSVAGGH